MTTFYLVRHGQPDYNGLSERNFFDFGRDFAPLSPLGMEQAEQAAADSRLHTAELIISSPYTRALQTAQIISMRTGIPVEVELDLHEWIPDLTNKYTTAEESFALSKEFNDCCGEYPTGKVCRWETLSSMRKRIRAVADKYADRDKVIFVGHGMAFRTLTYIEELPPGGIVECLYEKGQPFCEYSFF